tara:strand:+ start:356 stop:496 length:141 start_codon:yes stop_codon:yes gene_type:complete
VVLVVLAVVEMVVMLQALLALMRQLTQDQALEVAVKMVLVAMVVLA